MLRRALETFLGGMETKKQYRYMSAEFDLETFLGGMETKLSLCAKAQLYCLLETFLGGMETGRPGRNRLFHFPTLKPSLVEWKRKKRFRVVGAP